MIIYWLNPFCTSETDKESIFHHGRILDPLPTEIPFMLVILSEFSSLSLMATLYLMSASSMLL